MRHAFLIAAHRQFEILGKMISLLDDDKCDFFIHIDKKTNEDPKDYLRSMVKKSKLHFIDRINVTWGGGYSQIDCTLHLLSAAVPLQYDYYHYLSGVDFPIKTKDIILQYFEENDGCQFIHFERPIVQEKYVDRLRYHSIFQDTGNSFLQKIDKVIRKIERTFKYDRLRKNDIKLQYGTNWFSITHDFAAYVINQKKMIKSTFSYTRCGDELFIQTMLVNSPFSGQLKEYAFHDDYRSCMRFIDWRRGKPYVFRLENLDELLNSPYLFARKFDLNVDPNIIEALYSKLS